jgi:hypothetical protein
MQPRSDSERLFTAQVQRHRAILTPCPNHPIIDPNLTPFRPRLITRHHNRKRMRLSRNRHLAPNPLPPIRPQIRHTPTRNLIQKHLHPCTPHIARATARHPRRAVDRGARGDREPGLRERHGGFGDAGVGARVVEVASAGVSAFRGGVDAALGPGAEVHGEPGIETGFEGGVLEGVGAALKGGWGGDEEGEEGEGPDEDGE